MCNNGELCCLLLTLSSQVKRNRPIILSSLVSENEQQAAVGAAAHNEQFNKTTSPLSNYCRGGFYTLKKQLRDFHHTVCVHCVILSSRLCEKKSFISSCLLRDLVFTRWIKVPPRSESARRLLKTAERLLVENSSNIAIGVLSCLETSRMLC